ncbi:MAG: GxxExxY protein, partial [Anaerolineales bacterium]|nr:GxxExxY protein [Anaerolineales bacterium]
ERFCCMLVLPSKPSASNYTNCPNYANFLEGIWLRFFSKSCPTPLLHDAHRAQAINYLAATGFELVILLNFGEPSLKQERLVRFKNSAQTKSQNS